MSKRTCGVEGCDRPLIARELCAMHYQRWRSHGDPSLVLPRRGNDSPRPVVTERTCRVCGFHGPVDAFKPKANLCRRCSSERSKAWALANPEAKAASRARNREAELQREEIRKATRKGLDPALVASYRSTHSGVCDICGKVPGGRRPWLYVDHDHASGAFRGLLCGHCNTGLGYFFDNVELMRNAITYLRVSPGDLLALIQGEPATTTSSQTDAHLPA